MKTPEEYFVENVNLPSEEKQDGGYTDAEQAFMDKYMGIGGQAAFNGLDRVEPRGDSTLPGLGSGPVDDYGEKEAPQTLRKSSRKRMKSSSSVLLLETGNMVCRSWSFRKLSEKFL